MLFGRYWLHAATERALTDRAGMEERRLRSLVPWLVPWLYLLWLLLTMGLEARGQQLYYGCTLLRLGLLRSYAN